MASNNIELRVGLVIIAGLVIFVGAVIWIQGYRFGKRNYTVTAVFDEVGSLSPGDPVMVSGIRKGKIRSMDLIKDGVIVTFILGTDVMLKEDATATVKNIGLMGERFLAVTQGKSDKPFDLSGPIIGSYDTGIPEVMGMMGEMIAELRNLVLSLKGSIASEKNLEKLSTTIGNFENLSKSLSEYMSRNRITLDKTAENFLKASAELKNIAVINAGRIDTFMTRVDSASVRLDTVVVNLEYVAKTAREFARNLNEGDGTLQLLVDDRRLYDDLRKTADNIDDLINDIRANPRKYINFTVELF
ncbi:MAG: MCE family protein [Candidatus Zixiibacteriota bacterium]|nr:MAG: MCE family protein [candidate division Zixibacteria bacterium]